MSTAGIRFFGIARIESTISYCCNDGTHGIGSFACCQNSSSIFQISSTTKVIVQMPRNQLTTTATSASLTSTSISTTSRSTIPTNSATDTPGGGNSSRRAAIGAGVGVSLGLIALAGIGYLFWRRKGKS